MLLTLLATIQAYGGLGAELPGEASLRFVFYRDPRAHALIAGTSSTPTEWGSQAFYQTVRQCGGKDIAIDAKGGRAVAITARNASDRLAIARCVRAATSYRFNVTVQGRGFGEAGRDREPFRELWNI